MKTHTNIRNFRPLVWIWAIAGILFMGCDESTYQEWDDDDNQALSQQEFVEGFNATDHFAKWDIERDGSLTQNEFFAGSFALLDKSNDGNLDSDEWGKFADHFREETDTDMNTADADGNGQISKSEYIQHLSHSGFYTSWDANQNNRLDPIEFAEGIFAAWDADNNSQITEDEYTAWQENIETWQVVSMENLLPDVEENDNTQNDQSDMNN